ncbi:hypothetical protein ACTFIZ_001174 [Dictyostelium cf. discoideum]
MWTLWEAIVLDIEHFMELNKQYSLDPITHQNLKSEIQKVSKPTDFNISFNSILLSSIHKLVNDKSITNLIVLSDGLYEKLGFNNDVNDEIYVSSLNLTTDLLKENFNLWANNDLYGLFKHDDKEVQDLDLMFNNLSNFSSVTNLPININEINAKYLIEMVGDGKNTSFSIISGDVLLTVVLVHSDTKSHLFIASESKTLATTMFNF